MSRQRTFWPLLGWSLLALVTGLIGLFGVGVYLFTVIDSIGEADRSLLFWYLPFLFAGLMALPVAWLAVRKLWAERGEKTP